MRIEVKYPEIDNSFFCKVIGRGYPTPTNKFRWCTDRLRIRPIQDVFDKGTNRQLVLLGIRDQESVDRSRRIKKYAHNEKYFYKQSNYKNSTIFSPIIDYTEEDVWYTINNFIYPKSINRDQLRYLYSLENKENTINDDTIKSSMKGRFGCWTCTVVRKDKAIIKLIEMGYTELIPLYDYRNWLMKIRDDEKYRCKYRRNGVTGLGPFTLAARKEMLDELLRTQEKSGMQLISSEQIDHILYLWELDKESDKYKEK